MIASMNTDCPITEKIAEYFTILVSGERSLEAYNEYKPYLEQATPIRVNEAIDTVLANAARKNEKPLSEKTLSEKSLSEKLLSEKSPSIDDFKIPVARLIRTCAASLDILPLPNYADLQGEPGKVLLHYVNENESIGKYLKRIQRISKELPKKALVDENEQVKFLETITKLSLELEDIGLIKNHYIDLQTDLFSRFEKTSPRHLCTSLMWAIQDDVLVFFKDLQKGIEESIQNKNITELFLTSLGNFFLTASSLQYREKHILFPSLFHYIKENKGSLVNETIQNKEAFQFTSRTGSLSRKQLELILNLLPVDFSFVGKDDRVEFYSDPEHRIFPRTPSVIGREVEKCHPPKSLDTVNEIIRSFKEGKKDSEVFYINKNGRFIFIQYFAVRDENGEYEGCLEVSQDATYLRSLEGEKRLL